MILLPDNTRNKIFEQFVVAQGATRRRYELRCAKLSPFKRGHHHTAQALGLQDAGSRCIGSVATTKKLASNCAGRPETVANGTGVFRYFFFNP